MNSIYQSTTGTLPLVSIIIPVYNAEKYLLKTVQSVLAQTFENFECILVDDFSLDSSRQIMADLVKSDCRIKAIYLEKNGGPATARNSGISASKGEFVTFIDADDLWATKKIERQISTFDGRQELGIVGTNGRLIDAQGRLLNPFIRDGRIRRGKVSPSEFLLKGLPLSTSSVMIRRACLDQCGVFKENYRIAEDFELWLRILDKFEVEVLDEELFYIRKHDTNISSNRYVSRYCKILIYENEVLPNIDKLKLNQDLLLLKLQKMYTTYGKMLLKIGDYFGSVVYLNKSIALRKSFFVTLRAYIYKFIAKTLDLI